MLVRVAVLALALVAAIPAMANATTWNRAWGLNVVNGGAGGFEICQVAANCQAGAQTPATGGALSFPDGVAVDSAGNVYVADPGHERIEKFDSAGNFISAWGEDVNGGTGYQICTVAANCQSGVAGTLGGEMGSPHGLAIDAAGDVFEADRENNRIQEFTSDGTFVRAWGGDVNSADPAGTGFDVCTVAANCQAGSSSTSRGGEFNFPSGIAVDSAGDLYVTDRGNRRVQEFAVGTSVTFARTWGINVDSGGGTGFEVCTVAADCQAAANSTGDGPAGELTSPTGIAVGPAGDVFVADSGDARIQVFSAQGAFERTWGWNVDSTLPPTGLQVCTVAAHCQDGTGGGGTGQLDNVAGGDSVAVSPTGLVYVVDEGEQRVAVYTTSGEFERAWGKGVDPSGTGFETCTTDCQAGTVGDLGGELDYPQSVALDSSADAIVTQGSGQRVDSFTDTAPLPAYHFSASNYTVGEGASSATITVQRTGDLSAASTVDYATSDGTAHAGSDYTATSGTLSFAPGGASQSFAVPINASGLHPTETVNLTLSNPSPGTLANPATATITIQSNEPPQFQFTSDADSVDTTAGEVAITVQRTVQLIGSADIDYSTADGTAVAGRDYTATSGTLSFADGQASQTFDVPIIADPNVDGNKTFSVTLAVPTGGTATLGDPSVATVTIIGTPIHTTITSGPNAATNNPTPTLGFTADPPGGATFLCSVDHGAQSACTSPFTTGHLSDGLHQVEVQAVAPSGVKDQTPATRDFFVDTVAPVTTLQVLGGQRGIAGAVHGTVIMSATASDPNPSSGGVSTHCELLSATDPAPVSYAAITGSCYLQFVSKPGSYVLYGASTDGAGNTEAVKSVAFTLLPEVDVYLYSLPPRTTWQRQPQFHFASTTARAGFLCQIDNGGYSSCQSPWLSPAQNPGQHTFSVRAVAPDGAESSPATYDYTINAPTDATPGHCAVDPFVVDPTNPNGGNTIGCGFGNCPPHVACSQALQACPYGAICTLRFTSHFEDDDPAITFSLVPLCENGAVPSCLINETGDDWDVQQRYGTTVPFPAECGADVLDNTTGGCDLTTSQAFIGNGETTSPICYAQITSDSQLIGPGDTRPRDFGPDSERRLNCDATESIAPASVLDLASVAPASNGSLYTSVVYIPTTGDLVVIQNGEALSRADAHAARKATGDKRAAAPAIKPIKLTVKHPGGVAVRFRLNTAARKYLARHHKLSLRVKFTFTPPHQAAINKVHTITFIQPAKPPSAKELKAKSRRLCLREHPRAAKICNRL